MDPLRNALLTVAVAVAVRAQNPASASISTDRPSITDSSAVVGKGVVQLENGFLYTKQQPSDLFDFPETLIRFGFGRTTEARVTAPNYNHFVGQPSGFGDLSLGLKQQIYSNPKLLEVSAVVAITLPTGARPISSEGYDTSIQVTWSRKLGSKWTCAGMESLYVRTQGGSHRVTGESTFLVDRQLTGRWDVLSEYAGDFPQAGSPTHLIHFGATYKITSNQQIDVHGGAGLSAAAVNKFIGFGYSFRFRIPTS